VINRSLLKIRTRAVRDVGKRLKIRPLSLIRARTKIDKATRARPVGALRVLVTPISASRLSGARETRTGVSATGGRTWVGAFIAKGRGGNVQVFKRQPGSKHRKLGKGWWSPELPIDSIKVAIQAETEEILRAEQKNALADAVALMRRELTYRIGLRKVL
jgi:hypothetical protein